MGWKDLETEPMNIGGQLNLPFFKAKMIKAYHSSSNILEDEKKIIYLGNPAGYIIETILHAGDTSLHKDMKLIGQQHSIDLAFLPIGDRFTMGIDDAVQAAEWINPKLVVPIHYNTFPFIVQDAEEFVIKLSEKGITGIPLHIGEKFSPK
ncbi:hypothetical protein J6TS1_48440 [Siminovitchia terrae]|uniref:Metal-dependent hydrolase n=2 Tax=Siminovitchia terrae TaxID=1914933 RepID=A0ABQ4L486_SIMTE|nr:hypothetical protein J6TS1_48440 [Siminovitchia terrae]